MADSSESQERQQFVCPAFFHPGQVTGCVAPELRKEIEELRTNMESMHLTINGAPNDPPEEAGIKGMMATLLAETRMDRKRRWRPEAKLALASLLVVSCATPGWFTAKYTYDFIVRVNNAVHQIEELHKTQVVPKRGFLESFDPAVAAYHPPPAQAGLSDAAEQHMR